MNYFRDNLFREIIVDNFAGGGGASTGIEFALGEPVDIAINHDEIAIQMHTANHPFTTHYRENVWDINPVEVAMGRKVGLAWFSPDCTHFSKAKGGKPRKKEIRGLAWVVIKWAATVKPRVIMLENVEEFKTWGPLNTDGYPIKEKQGQTFKSWLSQLKDLGYAVEMKELRACDFGAPTTRKRLFIIARCDGEPIVWPSPTHGNGQGLKPFRTAAEIIDWSVNGKSIFIRKKPLVEATLKRITRGIDKFVIKNPSPFLLQYHTESKDQNARVYSIDEPLMTVDGSNRYGLVTPVMSQIGHTGFKSDRNRSVEEPLSTIVSKNEHLLVSPHIVKHYSGDHQRGSDVNEPLGTITSIDHNGLISAVMSNYYGNGDNASDVNEPAKTVIAREISALVKVHFKKQDENIIGYWPEIRSLLNKHAGYDIKDDEMMIFEINGIEYVMVDIEMRMLMPKELYAAQGFPPDYNFDLDGQLSKTEQIKKCGNSVCPQVATALVRANFNKKLIFEPVSSIKELYRKMEA